MLDIEKIWFSDEYKDLREQTQGRLCFICLGGSHAYGTNIEGSDIDIRGVMLPTKEELIGLKHFEQKEDSETDTVFYEFNKFIKLVSDCNPNVIEMLGCQEYLVFNEVGEMLLKSVNLFLSKKCLYTFSGYATAQLRKVESALCHDEYNEEESLRHIKDTMEVAIDKLSNNNEIFKDGGIKVQLKDNKLLLDINVKEKPIDLVRASLNDILTIEHSYNKMNGRNTKKDFKHLCKHIMHLVRLYLTCFDILEKHKIETYRENDRQLLLDIRNGKYIVDNRLTEEFYSLLKELEERLEKDKAESTLPSKPNYRDIEKLVIAVNEKVITDTVKYYDKPLKEVNIY